MPKIKCTVSGLHYSVTTAHKQELVKRFGSEENLINSYVSRDAKRLMKEGKTAEEIQRLVQAGELSSHTKAPAGRRGRTPKATVAPDSAL